MSATTTTTTYDNLIAPADVTAETKVGDVFETRACGRCGGSGEYSFNYMHGTMCYGCSGKGYVYTKRGAEALRYWRALSECPVRLVQVGDRIFEQGWRRVLAITDNAVEQRVGSIVRHSDPEAVDKVAEAVERGASIKPTTFDGEPASVVYEGLTIETQKINLAGRRRDDMIRVSDPATAVARLKAAAEYQLALTKTGKARKGSRWA